MTLKGFSQKFVVDQAENYFPVIIYTTNCGIVAFATYKEMDVKYVKIKTLFLYDENIDVLNLNRQIKRCGVRKIF